MSKTETFATADMKGKVDRDSQPPQDKKRPQDNKAAQKTTNAFFDRMSKTET